jgi:cathepsin A (carboxypeptidase C)
MIMRAVLFAAASAQLIFHPPADEAEVLAAKETLLAEERLRFEAEVLTVGGLASPTLCDPKVKQSSGYLKAAGGNQYFFWLFESRSNPSKDPLVMWLNGGPGCSSILGMLSENGPCTVNKDGATTTPNAHSWNSNANMIYVDQPAQTGFSKGLDLAHDENGVEENMVAFLQSFYEAHPQYKSNPFYIFGESYAGHYVPAIAHAVWADKTAAFKVPLAGIGIGNGLTDPEEQYKWYADMGLDGGKSEGGTLEKGVLTNKFVQAAMRAAIVPCTYEIKKCNEGNGTACSNAYVICNYATLIPYKFTGMNPYDMRVKCQSGNLCYDFSHVDTFLNKPETREAIGATKKWTECNKLVNLMFQHDWMKDYETKLPELLGSGIRVLVYAGDVDFICNWLGNKKWTLAMDWPHKVSFNEAKDADWQVDGKAAGRLRTSNGFSFLQVFQAGHMVPMDQPAAALEMLNAFTSNKLGEHQDEVLVI